MKKNLLLLITFLLIVFISSSAFADTFYVRTDGNDANSGKTNIPEDAFRTIQKAANTVVAGDIVQVQTGTYNEAVLITSSGTQGNLIAYCTNGEVIIDGQKSRSYCIKLDGADYIKIEGFTCSNSTGIGILLDNNANHNIITSNTSNNHTESGIKLKQSSCYNTISSNNLYNNTAGSNAWGYRVCGIYVFGYSHYNTITNNEAYNNSTGIWLEGNSSSCTITNNKSYSNSYSGIIIVGGTNNNTIEYNLVYSNTAYGFHIGWSANNNLVKNNTIYNNGSDAIALSNTTSNIIIKNNIISDNARTYNSCYGIRDCDGTGSSITLAYNNIYNNGSTGTNNYSGLLVGLADISLDPQFKSIEPQSPDFLKLKSLAHGDSLESPCIDAGDPANTHSVQSGKRIDIGAYDEYSHQSIQGGLLGEYYNNSNFTSLASVRIDPRINFDWGNYTPEVPVDKDTFSIRWTGQIKIDKATTYTFYLTTDDGSRLWIDGQLIIDKWFNQGPTSYSANINLTEGYHDIKYEYYENGGWAIVKLYWNSPYITKEIVPQDHLYYFDRLPQDDYVQGGLKGSYYDSLNYSSHIITRIDPGINFDWGYNMPDVSLGADYYSVKWKGKVKIDTSDTYTFYTISDDGVRLWINNRLLINEWHDQGAAEYSTSLYLTPGLYDIELNYYERGWAASAKLLWSSSKITKQPIDHTHLYYHYIGDDHPQGGLIGHYFNNNDFTSFAFTRIDPMIDFDWINDSPDSSIWNDTYSIRWTGQVKADYDETYTFYTNSDDGVKLWIDGQLLINNWFDHGPTEYSASVQLSQGWHDIKIDYYENDWQSSAKLFWSSPSISKTVIPYNSLRPYAPGQGDNTLFSDDFEDGDYNEWLVSGNTYNIDWQVKNGRLRATEKADAGYSYIRYTDANVPNYDLVIEYDTYFSGNARWGGVWYKGIYCDVNPTRTGWRDSNQRFFYKPLVQNAWHHIKLVIKQANPYPLCDLYIDNIAHFTNEPIEVASYPNENVGFVSNYYDDWVEIDNIVVIFNDNIPPSGTITINNDESYTNSRDAALTLSASDDLSGVDKMQFSNDGTNWSTLEDYATSKSWTLSLGDGEKRVYAKFKDGAGNWSDPTSDTIILDTTPPVVNITSPQDGTISSYSPIPVSGTIDDNSAQVVVNDISATVANNIFTATEIPITEGYNKITAIATDTIGNKGEDFIGVTLDPNFCPTEIFEDFDGNNQRVDYWWNGFDGDKVYKRSLDNTIYRSGATSMKVEYDKLGYPWSLFAVQPKRNGIDNDFSKYDKFSFWVYTDDPQLTIRVKFEDYEIHTWEQDFSSSAQGSWHRFVCDFSDVPEEFDLTHIGNILFFVFPGQSSPSGTFYMDDLTLHSTKPYLYPPLTKPNLTGPSESAYGDYQLNWTDITGSTIYELLESDSPTFDNHIYYWSNNIYRDFEDRIQPGNYYYKVRAWSNVPEEDGISSEWSNTISVEIIDGFPVISEVFSHWDGPPGDGIDVHKVGAYIRINVKEKYNAPDIASGTIRITSISQGYDSGSFELTKEENADCYFYHWDTNGLNSADDYVVAATLTDTAGQTDTDGSPYDPDLTISLIIKVPARYGTSLETDFFIPAIGIPLKFERYYNSDMLYDSPIGDRWTHNYNMCLEEQDDGCVTLLWDMENYWTFFIKNPDGSYKSPPGKYQQLTKNPDGTFTLKKPNNIIYNFNLDNKIANIQDLNGNQITLDYTDGLLTTLTDASGRQLTFDYYFDYSNPKIKSITDFTGRIFNYEYDPDNNLIKYIDPLGYETTYDYDGHNLTTITNPRGYHTYFEYIDNKLYSRSNDNNINYTSYTSPAEPNRMTVTNARDYETTYIMEDPTHSYKIDALGNTITIISDDQHNPLYVTDQNDHTWDYTYDEKDNMLTQKSPPDKDGFRHTWTYTYHPEFNKVETITDPEDNVTINEYHDVNGNLLKTKEMLGAQEIITSYTYYPNGLLWTKTEPKGNVETPDGSYTTTYEYEYDQYGSLIKKKVIDSLGNVTIDVYNELGSLETMTTPEGNTTTYDYDALNRLTKITDPEGNTTEYEYDGMDNLTTLTITDILNPQDPTITNHEYDEVDRLKKTTDALDNAKEYGYDLCGNLKAATVTDGTTLETPFTYTTYEYDELNRIFKIHQWISDTVCYTTVYKYDKVGNRTKVIDGKDNTTTYDYDDINRLWKLTDAKGNTTSYTYDKVDNLLTETDAKGNITTNAYDDLYRLESVTDALSNVTMYEYDENSNHVKLSDANSHQTQYTYDEINRLTSTIFENGTTKTNEYEFDTINKIYCIRKTDQKSQTITYDYDYQRRLIKKTYPDSSQVAYDYDGRGRMTDLTDSNGTIHYDYDILARVTQVTYPDSKTVDYEYNGLNSRTKLIYPDSSFITYEYDKLNRLKLIKNQIDQVLVDYDYDLQVNLRKRKDLLNNNATFYGYNELYQLTNIYNTYTSHLISGFTYGYDEIGNRKYVRRGHEQHRGDVYTYNSIYQLTNVKYNVTDPILESETPGSSPFESQKTYSLDPVGNRLSVTNGSTITYAPNNMNQYETVGDVTYFYDANGNMTEKNTPSGATYYSYDYENRLISVDSGLSIVDYTYAPYNHRIQKNIDGVTTNYIYDGNNVIAEYDSSNNLIAKYVHGPKIDEVIMLSKDENNYYYQYDGLGSVT
ncbi:MAG: right-handed parallel beta-helix repeat-containing protein, partial [Spirochaetes bacterium]|nr:right-handed parallel beta-helix repeat-containing protein [Spirochaetota bacterium]